MWLVVISLAAAIVTAIWYAKDANGNYKLGFLGLMLWGAAILVFVDHVMGYLMEGGEFLEMTPEATLLGIVLVIVALVVWEAALLIEDPLGRLKRLKEV